MIKMKPVDVNANFSYPLETSENQWFLMFWGDTKGNVDPKWVKQQQIRREQHNLMWLAWNSSSSTGKQNIVKIKLLDQNKQLCLISLFDTTYIEEIFFKGLFFRSKLVLY